MRQVLFELGPLSVPTHAFFVGLAFLVGFGVVWAEARRRAAWDDRMLPVIGGIVVGGALGARLGSLAEAALADGAGPAALAWAWAYGGRSVLGGLGGAYVGALVVKRVSGYRTRTGDLFAPAVALGLAVGRIGCFLSEAPGRPADLPWSVTVTPAQATAIPQCPGCVAGLPMHPSFLYEIAFLLLAYAGLRWARDRVTAPGELFPLFLAGYAVFRLLVEFTRANPPQALGLSGSQWFLIVVSPLLIRHVARQARQGTYARLRPARRPALVGGVR